MSGHLLSKETSEEGEVIPYHLSAMEFGVEMDGSQDFFQMFWPVVVSHKIDDKEHSAQTVLCNFSINLHL